MLHVGEDGERDKVGANLPADPNVLRAAIAFLYEYIFNEYR